MPVQKRDDGTPILDEKKTFSDDDDEGVVSEDLLQTMEDRDGIADTLEEDDLDDASMVLDEEFDDDDFDADDEADDEAFDNDDEF